MFRVDLTGATGQAVVAMNLGTGLDNKTDFGKGYLHHLVHYDPEIGAMDDLGVFAVKNPDGTARPSQGNHTLPDGTLTPLHVILALIVTRDETTYASTIYPFTLLKIEAVQASRRTPAP